VSKTFSYIFLDPGSKVLIVHRRLFAEDRPRFFVGTVDGFNEATGLLKITGYSFAENKAGGKLVKKKQPRTKILSLTSGTLIVYQLPTGANPAAAKLAPVAGGGLLLTDGGHLNMDLSESSE
jgi:hypothetical protein